MENVDLGLKLLLEWGPLALGWVVAFLLWREMIRLRQNYESKMEAYSDKYELALAKNTQAFTLFAERLDKR